MEFSGVTFTGIEITSPIFAGTTTLLMHFDGANGSNVFIDSACANLPFTNEVMIPERRAVLSTSNYKFGNASLSNPYADNSGVAVGFIYTENGLGIGEALDIWSENFTIEGWFYSTMSNNGILARQLIDFTGGSSWGLSLSMTWVDGTSVASACSPISSSGNGGVGSLTAPLNTWVHFAIVRNGANVNCFINGIKDAGNYSLTGGVWTGSARPTRFSIGGFSENFLNRTSWEGWIDEVRITKGAALYTSNFTPPIAPFSDPVC